MIKIARVELGLQDLEILPYVNHDLLPTIIDF